MLTLPAPPEPARLPLLPPAAPRAVLLVSEPGVDGVFRHVEALAGFLLDAGVRVSLAYSSVRGSPALDRLVGEVARRGGGRTLDLRVGNAPGPRDALTFARLAALARAERPDVVHAHSSKAGALARALPATGVRARFFYTPHAYYQMHEPPGRGGLKRGVFEGVERVLGRVGTTINSSASESVHARDRLGLASARRVTIPNGVDMTRFRPAGSPKERRALRAELDLPADAPLLGTVARLSAQKDPVTLYRAVLAALDERADLHFAHLNATGELAEAVGELLAAAPPAVRARVHRRPATEEPARFYRALDAFVLPSRYEGLSFAALEAAATGLPLILSDAPGNADLRAHAFDRVRWTPPGNAGALTLQILAWAAEAAADAVPGRPVPCNHREVAQADFARERQFDELLRCYAGRGVGA